MTSEELIEEFDFLDTMEDRYKLIIELGNDLPELPEQHRIETNKVQGCQSQVWLAAEVEPQPDGQSVIVFQADSDAQIVKGLVGILVMLLSGKSPEEILKFNLQGVFEKLELKKHLSPSRSNGLNSMVRRIAEIAASVHSASETDHGPNETN